MLRAPHPNGPLLESLPGHHIVISQPTIRWAGLYHRGEESERRSVAVFRNHFTKNAPIVLVQALYYCSTVLYSFICFSH